MIGTRLGPYEIIEQIGVGGMATVFRAYQPSISRFVAVKVIHRAIAADARALERFQREARLIARLEHPHLLPVYDYDGLHEPPYIVMRYVEGGTLKDVLDRSGALPLADTLHIMRQIASALDYAHRQGVIHRDIKPSNIMIDGEGNIFLTDFGIARIAAGGEGITQTGMAVGTPGYMAPEQGMGAENVDHRADIYSLGVMFFQMVSGNLPFSAETPMGVIMKHITEPVPHITDFNPTLPDGLDAVLNKALAKSPEDRYQSANDFVEAIGQVVGSTSTSLRPQVIQRAAQENVGQILQRREQNRAEIEHTMATFDALRQVDPKTGGGRSTATDWKGSEEDSDTILTPTDQRAAAGVIAAPIPPAALPPQSVSRSRLPIFLIAGAVVIVVVIGGVLALSSRSGGAGSETPTHGATEVPQVVANPTDTPTDTPQPSATNAATRVPTPSTPQAVTVRDLIVRAGPGSQYPAVGTLRTNDQAPIIGISEDGSWFEVQMPDGSPAWLAISAAFVTTTGNLGGVPIVAAADTNTPAPTSAPPPTAIDTNTPAPTDTPQPTATDTNTNRRRQQRIPIPIRLSPPRPIPIRIHRKQRLPIPIRRNRQRPIPIRPRRQQRIPIRIHRSRPLE